MLCSSNWTSGIKPQMYETSCSLPSLVLAGDQLRGTASGQSPFCPALRVFLQLFWGTGFVMHLPPMSGAAFLCTDNRVG